MFRKMRRFKQELSFDECEKILQKNSTGILGVVGDEGYPYTVPLNYAYFENKIYFHSAKAGHKIDAIKENNKVLREFYTNSDIALFCIVDKDELFSENLTTLFKSVIIFGKAEVLEDADENQKLVEIFSKKYSDNIEKIRVESQSEKNNFYMVKIEIEKISGKQAIELMKGEEENV